MPQPNTQAQERARGLFDSARRAAQAGDFDAAIDAYVEGLAHAPDAVQEGHVELRVLALRRQRKNGAKPSADEVRQRLSQGQSPLEKMLSAEYLLAKNPEHLAYGQAVLRAAVAGGYRETAKWMADLMFLANNNAKKPSAQIYILLKDSYAAIGRVERAVAACQRAARARPGDPKLAVELKQLSAKLASIRQKRAGAAAEQSLDKVRKPRPQRTRVRPAAASAAPVAPDEQAEEVEMPQADEDQALAAARAFFDKARKAAEGKNYDYAIEMYLEGLQRAPDALEEGHLPLCELGLQRRGRGGKKPSMMERVKRLRGKNPLEQMLNAEYLFAKDPDHLPYAEAMLKAAVEGDFKRTAHWIANLIFQTNNAMEKPSLQTYLLLKDSYAALGQYDKAVAACQRATRLKPDSKELADDFKNLSAELTMARGRYNAGGDFRQSIKDQETQAKLYAQDRIVKTKDYRTSAVEDARKAYARDPDPPKNLFNLTEALADLGKDEADVEAIQLLEDAYDARDDFNFKERAGLLRIKQLRRQLREARERLEKRPGDAQAKADVDELTATLNNTELQHYRLCVENYPTDLAPKYEYALRLMTAGRFNEAIPLFQEAQKDPRRRISAMGKIGYCFFMKGWYADAVDVFARAIESYEIKDDAIAKELRYNLARAHEEHGDRGKALEIYRRIAQLDFGYKDVSERVDRLRAEPGKAGGGDGVADGQ